MNIKAVREIFLAMLLATAAGNAAAGFFSKTQADQGISAFNSGNYKYARAWLSTEEAANDPRAWYYLGRMYQEGLGGFAVDLKRAEKLFHQSAEKGIPESMLAIADLYSRGGGVTPNFSMARIWHEKAANAGSIEGMLLIGRDLMGANGLPPDYSRARVWLEQAASAGNGEAMRELANLYRNGLGVDVSMIDALMWYRLAVKAGNTEAAVGNDFLSRILPPESQAAADRLALEWEVLTGRAPAPPVQQAADPKKTSDTRPAIKAPPVVTGTANQS